MIVKTDLLFNISIIKNNCIIMNNIQDNFLIEVGTFNIKILYTLISTIGYKKVILI